MYGQMPEEQGALRGEGPPLDDDDMCKMCRREVLDLLNILGVDVYQNYFCGCAGNLRFLCKECVFPFLVTHCRAIRCNECGTGFRNVVFHRDYTQFDQVGFDAWINPQFYRLYVYGLIFWSMFFWFYRGTQTFLITWFTRIYKYGGIIPTNIALVVVVVSILLFAHIIQFAAIFVAVFLVVVYRLYYYYVYNEGPIVDVEVLPLM